MRQLDADPIDDSTMHLSNRSFMVVVAQALYDSAQRDGATSFTDKRTGIEVLSWRESLNACLTTLRWAFSGMQFSDDLTEPSAKHVLADRVRKGSF